MIPWPLVALTVTTGMVDAVSFLRLGHVFVANMTGNVVFLGFALGGYRGVSASGSLVAIAAFLAGALIGGALVRRAKSNEELLLQATILKFALAVAALLLVSATVIAVNTLPAYALTALLGLAMGVQNAAVRKLAVADFTTTVLTMTLTGIAADVTAGTDAKIPRRFISVVAMFAGAFLGAFLILRAGIVPAVGAVAILFALTIVLVALQYRRRPG